MSSFFIAAARNLSSQACRANSCVTLMAFRACGVVPSVCRCVFVRLPCRAIFLHLKKDPAPSLKLSLRPGPSYASHSKQMALPLTHPSQVSFFCVTGFTHEASALHFHLFFQNRQAPHVATFAGYSCFLTCSSSKPKVCASNVSASTRDFVRGFDASDELLFFVELSSSDADSDFSDPDDLFFFAELSSSDADPDFSDPDDLFFFAELSSSDADSDLSEPDELVFAELSSSDADSDLSDPADVGGSDAGGSDFLSDSGGSDAGGSDSASESFPDAGGSDAGGSDAGGSDAGGSDAGGSDSASGSEEAAGDVDMTSVRAFSQAPSQRLNQSML
jgi:hypothetical protein